MTTWAVEDGKPNKLGSVEPGQKEIVEKNLEDWIVEDPALLGERPSPNRRLAPHKPPPNDIIESMS